MTWPEGTFAFDTRNGSVARGLDIPDIAGKSSTAGVAETPFFVETIKSLRRPDRDSRRAGGKGADFVRLLCDLPRVRAPADSATQNRLSN